MGGGCPRQRAGGEGQVPGAPASVSGCGVSWAGPADLPAWKSYRVHSFLDYIMGGCQIHFTVSARAPPHQQSPGALPTLDVTRSLARGPGRMCRSGYSEAPGRARGPSRADEVGSWVPGAARGHPPREQ